MQATAPPVIIPGLPNDAAMLCLLKVPRMYHACLASVCLAWRSAVCSPEFYHERRRLGTTDAWLVVVSVEILSAPTLLYSAYDLATRQLLFKVRFPPSLPVNEHTPCIKLPADADGGDRTSSTNFTGMPRLPTACKLSAALDVHRDASYNGKLAMSLKTAGNRKAILGSTATNTTWNSKCACSAPHKVDTCLQNLDSYRIVAMNEYFAVLGLIQHSGLRVAICTLTIYNTLTDEWRNARPLLICRDMFACGVIKGRLYVVGGCNEEGEMGRKMEVYDFEVDKWAMAEGIPKGVGRVEGDVVYQGKLYVQGWEGGKRGKCGVWVYKPEEDQWEKMQGREMGGQRLVATDKFLYAMDGQGEVSRYEGRSREWTSVTVPRRRPSKLTVPRLDPHTSQRAFGHGDDIFLLQETSGAPPCGVPIDGFTKCYRLLSVKPSWYHAGAVVQA